MSIVGSVVDPTGIAGAVFNPIAQTALVPVTDHVGYMISCTKYVTIMRTKMRDLNIARVSVEEHINRNKSSNLKIPSQVGGWLDEVKCINANVENFPTDVIGCCSLMIRHKLGRIACKIIGAIESATTQLSSITWTDDPFPVGRVSSMNAPTSATSIDHQDDFPSRKRTFTQALKAIETDHKSHMIALCGMGGVGKTRMMQRLKNVAKEKKLFKYIVEAVIGEKTDPIAIQKAIADYLGIQLNEETKSARADKIREWFKNNSDGGKTKFLIILDDVWEIVDLNDIGLSPLPNQGVNCKVLLTSRNTDVCAKMGVEVDSIMNLKVLAKAEAKSLFWQFVENSDPELHKIGEDIVKRCCGLPIAIKIMACTLKNKRKSAWKDALSSLEHHNIDDVASAVFKTSYDNLKNQETKSIFLLCGLFPEDFNIPTEELMRYGWGLKLFDRIYTIREARNRLDTCIERLIQTNLLIGSDDVGCVKMHDLVRAFVLDMFSKVEHASIVNHGSMSGWPENEMNDSCKKISLTCKSMFEFPGDLNFPNLSILKLMYGDKSLKFPQDFYEEMVKLQVISFDLMKCPLLPSSPQCSTNLRVLHLHHCSLMFDCSSIGNLLNLEVLSFAGSGITWLPSTIGNLKKLRLLDLTDCPNILIDNGILKKLVKLEELYTLAGDHQYEQDPMLFGDQYGKKVIRFTDENCNEMAIRSENLSALEFQFFENSAQPKNMSFKNLERFKISLGRYLYGNFVKSRHSYENTLKLVTNKVELLESRINELFEKTEVLCLSLGDMNDLADIEVKSSLPPQSSSFYNLRVLFVSKCVELRYLFTPDVANALSKLEHLEVESCDNMEELIHIASSREGIVTFRKLKFLSLHGLPNLLGFCRNVNIIELPQLVKLKLRDIPGLTSIYPSENKFETSCLFKEEVLIPKLEGLNIYNMENLKEIWPCELGRSERVMLREIRVESCKNLVNMFPCNPMTLLHHLEEIVLKYCDSIEVLFDIDMENISEIGESSNSNSLRSIELKQLGKLREVWRIKGADNYSPLIRGFQAVERISITECKKFRNVFTPTNTNFYMGALMEILIVDCGEEETTDILLKEETSRVGPSISNFVVSPSCLTHSFPNLRKLGLSAYKGVKVVFEIESPTSRELITTHHNQPLLPYIEDLDIRYMEGISHVWKCNWNKFFILQKKQSESPFHNLTTIYVRDCHNIKYLFSPLMAKLFSNLKNVRIEWCGGIEEVVSNRDDEDKEKTTFTSTSIHTTTTLFPHLDSLSFSYLKNLKCIGGSGAKDGSNEISFDNTSTATASLDKIEFSQASSVSWTLCEYSRRIYITKCDALSSAIPCYAAGQLQKLQELQIEYCSGMKEVFEIDQGMNKYKNGCDEENGGAPAITILNNVFMLPNLKILKINNCPLVEHIFTFSALESLRQLQELTICNCEAMKVIVKEEEYDEKKTATKASSKELAVFPCLKSIKLEYLPNLMGFFLGMNEFQWPSLDYVMIGNCPEMRVFAPGGSTAPKLKYIHTSLGKHSLEECGLNFHVTATPHKQTLFSSSFPATASEGMPWFFHNLIELHVKFKHNIEKIIPSNELLQLQKLEEIYVGWCDTVEEVFEAMEADTNSSSDFDESQTTIFKLPNLTQLKLEFLNGLRHIWKSNQWTVFEFPNLTRVSIRYCDRLEHVFTSSMVGSLLQLQELTIEGCTQMVEVIGKDTNVVVEGEEEQESDGKINKIILPCLKSLKLQGLPCLKGFCLGKSNRWTIFEFPNLTTVHIINCCRLEHVFTSSMVSSLLQLQELTIRYCSQMVEVIGKDTNVVVEKEEEEQESAGNINEIKLPRLRSLIFKGLPCLKGLCLGKEGFSFPLLDTLEINQCPAITTFTKGNLATPKLNEIQTGFGSFYVAGEDINSFIKIKQKEFKRSHQ